ncbi:DEAD/DEAH box helicase [Pseudomonas aeruginosa]
MTKTIYTAIAAPGAGKTQALIEQLKNYMTSGERVVIALPTLNLSDDILNNMMKVGITPKVINSNDSAGKTTHTINGTLRSGSHSVVVITHEGLRLSDPNLMRGHILVIDELPDPFELQHITNMSEVEASQFTSVLEKSNGRFSIKSKLKTMISERVKTYRRAEKNQSVASTLSEAEFKVFNAILSHGIVHTDDTKNEQNEIQNLYIIEFKDIFEHIKKSKETHILAANIEGGLFDLFLKSHEFQVKTSSLTPKHYEYDCNITIYPMLNEPWSKGKVLRDESGTFNITHHGNQNQLIDKIFSTAINNTPNERFIVIQNKWGKFSKGYLKQSKVPEIEFLDFDCRGLNTQTDKTAAILLFTGNPSPNDKKSLRIIAEECKLNYDDILKAWTVTKKLEAALQAVTRTAIRKRGNTEPVYFYVQDMQIAEYLKLTYMPNAKIDISIALNVPKAQDNRSKLQPNEKEEVNQLIKRQFDRNVKRSRITKSIMQTWGYSERQASRLVATVLGPAKNNPKPLENTEDLTRFLFEA